MRLQFIITVMAMAWLPSVWSAGAETPLPLTLRAKSAPSVPTIQQQQRLLSITNAHNEETTLRWQEYERQLIETSYEDALAVLDHSQDMFRELPYYYNRAALNLMLYFQNGKRRHLQHARLDFNSAIKACPHFYFAYFGHAQAAFLMRDYKKAYQNIRDLIDIFETHDNSVDVVLISNADFRGLIYLADLYMNGGMALYRLGSHQVHIDEHYDYALRLLQPPNVVTVSDAHQQYIDSKRAQYNTIRHAQLQTQYLIGFDMHSRFHRFDTTYDAGPFVWLSISSTVAHHPELLIPGSYIPPRPTLQTTTTVPQPTTRVREEPVPMTHKKKHSGFRQQVREFFHKQKTKG